MLPYRFHFLDTETTGFSPSLDRVIDIAILTVENGEVVAEYNSLVNPGTHIPSWVTGVSGINDSHVASSPTFEEVAPKLMEILSDGVFVAHNVKFDYGFLLHEFGRLGHKFYSPRLCTIDVSRSLYPYHPSHSLDNIIKRFDIEVINRHRAMDDTRAMLTFFRHLYKQFPFGHVDATVRKLISDPESKLNTDPHQLSLV